MAKQYLVFNAGSSSIKFKLFSNDRGNFKELRSGQVDRIGSQIKNHREALEKLIEDNSLELAKVDIIGHRIVHGGEEFVLPTELNKESLEKIEEYSKLAPLHNPHQLELVKAINALDSSISQWAVFDTAYFSDLPELTKLYPIPLKYYQQNKIRRYGFHGISHKYLASKGAEKLNLNLTSSNIITAHLGAGSSISAHKNGSPIDTSMGFTPLEGLMMQTRPGDIDPGIITYLEKEEEMTTEQIDNLLNNDSGLKAVAGRGDMRDILFLAGEKVEDDNYQPKGFDDCQEEDIKLAKLALKMFVYRVKKYIGAYTAALTKLDGLVFSGSIGSGSSVIREKITRDLKHILKGTKITHLKTNEELQIAKEIDLELNN